MYCIVLFNWFVVCTALGSRRSSTASEKQQRGKSLTRSKSPFRSFRWKKTKPAQPDSLSTGGGHYSDDEENFGRTIGRLVGGCDGRFWRDTVGEPVGCACLNLENSLVAEKLANFVMFLWIFLVRWRIF